MLISDHGGSETALCSSEITLAAGWDLPMRSYCTSATRHTKYWDTLDFAFGVTLVLVQGFMSNTKRIEI